jgi:hypothetical protein
MPQLMMAAGTTKVLGLMLVRRDALFAALVVCGKQVIMLTVAHCCCIAKVSKFDLAARRRSPQAVPPTTYMQFE